MTDRVGGSAGALVVGGPLSSGRPVSAVPSPSLPADDLDDVSRLLRVLSPPGDADRVRVFLLEEAPSLVRAALDHVLPPGLARTARCRVLRTKVKPGRRVTAWYEVRLDGYGRRHVVARWSVEPQPGSSGPAVAGTEAEAARRGLLEPFTRLSRISGDGRMHLLVAPLDPMFPQLPRLYDARQWGRLLPPPKGPAFDPATASRGAAVDVVRYRPGQRHVLRVTPSDGRALFAKVYRDSAGIVSMDAARVVGRALRGSEGRVRVATPHSYLEAERTVLWEAQPGAPLSERLRSEPYLAGVAGEALRALHGGAVADAALPAGLDVLAQVRGASRAAENVRALLPETGRTLLHLLQSVAGSMARLPPPETRLVHGDFKCDNVLADDGRLCLVDLDRVAAGDQAQDIGKMCSDLRWWAAATPEASQAESRGSASVKEFLHAYGCTDPGMLQRVLAYEVLFLLKAAARRIPVESPDWADAVSGWVDTSAALWSEGTP